MAVTQQLPARTGAIVGKVKWFDANKGYGFLTADSGAEVFVNIKDVENQIPLSKEEPVDFFTEAQPDGRERAMRVRSLNPQPQPVVQTPMYPHHYAYAGHPPQGYGYPPTAAHYSPYNMGMPPSGYAGGMGGAMPAGGYAGVCKWYNAAKGFGFITPNDGSVELYFKGTDIQGGQQGIESGEPVRYEAKHQDGKSWAVNVVSTRMSTMSAKRPSPDAYPVDPYAVNPPMKQPKTQYAPSPSQRYEQQQPQPFGFDQYQQAVPKMPNYGAVPNGDNRGYTHEYQPDPSAYQQAYRQY